jgi:four helix bundle protein
LEYQFILSRDLNFISIEISEKLLFQIEEIKKMLNSLISKLNK